MSCVMWNNKNNNELDYLYPPFFWKDVKGVQNEQEVIVSVFSVSHFYYLGKKKTSACPDGGTVAQLWKL